MEVVYVRLARECRAAVYTPSAAEGLFFAPGAVYRVEIPPVSMPFIPKDQAARILASIVESSDDAIIGTDLDGVILTWNDGATRLYGYPQDDVHGQSIALLIPPDGLEQHQAIPAQLRTGRRMAAPETRPPARD